MLGYKNLAWKSVTIPMIMPKPDVVALTGGYRKTPILQIGADIYCDTALISDVLEHLQPMPSVYPEPSKGLARTLAHWADNTLFWTSMAFNTQPKGVAQIFEKAPPEAARAFGEDRKAMSFGMPRLRSSDAVVQLVALTGYGQPEDVRLAMEAGFDVHLVKPVDVERVLEVLA
jgi:glutathione S-transferase